MSKFHRLPIARVERETRDAVAITFDVPAARLHGMLAFTIVTGALLIVLEAFSVRLRWLVQGRGLLVLGKLTMLVAIPFAWSSRLALLMGVIVLASVGSHMPARFRYYSVVDGRVL
jgi:hypothetical protein